MFTHNLILIHENQQLGIIFPDFSTRSSVKFGGIELQVYVLTNYYYSAVKNDLITGWIKRIKMTI